MISFIVAMDQNGLIGKDNDLPWRLPADLKRFKKITMGHSVIMGRKTFESIGKPLPGRENIVLTGNKELEFSGCRMFYDEKELLEFALNHPGEIFVLGGSGLFRLFMPHVKRLYVTRLHHEFSGNVYFPDIDWSGFTVIHREKGIKDEKNPYDYEYITYERK